MTWQSWIPLAAVLAASPALAGCGSKSSAAPPDDASADAFGHPATRDAGTGSMDARGPGHPNTGDDAGASPDGGVVGEAGTYDALPAPPQVQNGDGGVLASPNIVAIFFANEDPMLLPTLESFYTGIGASTYWAATSEYGVGPATATNVVLTEDAPATIDDTSDSAGDNTALETWLLNAITAAPSELPAWTPNTEYVVNYPATTKVTSDGDQCVAFDGYHSDFQNAAMTTTYNYAVVPRCTDMGSTLLATFASTASHELIEGATDPYPDYAPGWAQVDNAHLYFDEANTGSEIGDMCQDDLEAYYQFSDFPFIVQRFWSNKSALAGHDPCVPELPNTVFFNAVPELPDTGLFNYNLGNVKVDSVTIPVGQSKTIYVDLYSDGVIPDWDVQAYDFNYFYSGVATDALLTFDMPITKGNNGARLPVTITVKAAGNANTNMEVNNTELFVIESSRGTSNNAPQHYWYGVVTN
jgi:hypothetical protein